MYNMYESSSLDDFNSGKSRLVCKDTEYRKAVSIAESHCNNGSAVGCKIYNCGTGKLVGVILNDEGVLRSFKVVENENFCSIFKEYCSLVSKLLTKNNGIQGTKEGMIVICGNKVRWGNQILKQDTLTNTVVNMLYHIGTGYPIHSITFPKDIFDESVVWEFTEGNMLNISLKNFRG